jgi:hypothetical protein
VQMADQDRVDVDVIAHAPKLREHAVAAVEQQREIPLLDEITAARTTGITPGWGLSEHGNLHSGSDFLSRGNSIRVVPIPSR